jgi:hypothetical protein
MNDQDQTTCCSGGPFLSVLLIGISVAIFFIWQIISSSQQGAAFKSTVERQSQLVEQSKQIQGSLERLVLDVMDLAKTGDEDAKAVITKYGIQQQSQPAPAASVSPASK